MTARACVVWGSLLLLSCAAPKAAPLHVEAERAPEPAPSASPPASLPSGSASSEAPATTTPPPPPSSDAAPVSDAGIDAGPTPDPRITDTIDPKEQKLVLGATFPRFLTGDCPAVTRSAGTWTQLDALQESTYRRGLFTPTVAQRLTGSFTAPGRKETLYVIDVRDCVSNGFAHHVVSVFDTGALALKSPRPLVRVELHELPSSSPLRFVAIAERDGVDALQESARAGGRWVRVEAGKAAGAGSLRPFE